FFFSSRRRHTRSYGDWSSDVCSSDLRSASLGTARGASRHTSYASNLAPLIPSVPSGTATWRGSSSQLLSATVHQRGAPSTTQLRSEERRVGKECKTEVAADPAKKIR